MSRSSYRRPRFPVDVIQQAVWLYFRFLKLTSVPLGAVLLVLGSVNVNALDLKKLEGEYYVAPRDGQGPVEFGFIVRGGAAKELYANLPAEEKPDACTGGTQKSNSKGMFCIKDGSDYVCSLGYVLKTHEITTGPLSC